MKRPAKVLLRQVKQAKLGRSSISPDVPTETGLWRVYSSRPLKPTQTGHSAGATENAGKENAKRSKKQGWKMQERIMRE